MEIMRGEPHFGRNATIVGLACFSKNENMNKQAQALGRRAKGIPKNFSAAERSRRKELLALARAKRWLAKAKNEIQP